MEQLKNWFPNQKQVKCNKIKVEKNSGLAYACIYRYSMEDAMSNLKPNTFKLWLWLASNKPNFTVELSSTYLSKVLHASVNTIKASVNELIDKGYMIQDTERKHFYNFYEEPQKHNKITIQREQRQFTDLDTGEIFYLTYADLLENVGNESEAKQLWEAAGNEVSSDK